MDKFNDLARVTLSMLLHENIAIPELKLWTIVFKRMGQTKVIDTGFHTHTYKATNKDSPNNEPLYHCNMQKMSAVPFLTTDEHKMV
jgi:hypothetical protein